MEWADKYRTAQRSLNADRRTLPSWPLTSARKASA